jgi:hypothetical protein
LRLPDDPGAADPAGARGVRASRLLPGVACARIKAADGEAPFNARKSFMTTPVGPRQIASGISAPQLVAAD